MEDKLISFETAKLAKEKGFNVSTLDSFYLNGETVVEISVEDYPFAPFNWNSNTEFDFARPTQSLLQKWLREVHKNVILIHQYSDTNKYFYLIDKMYDFEYDWNKLQCNTYEEALEIGLYEVLKLIK